MKHLFHKRHHVHLKRRAILEFLGLFILVGISITQWEVVQKAIETVSNVKVTWLLILLASYWLVLPLTTFSYRLISPKPKQLNMFTTTLAHLAGAGPGRIIPGGIGNLTINALHLKKTCLSLEKSISVVVINNLIGILVSAVLVIFAFIIQPDTLVLFTNHVTSQQLLLVAAAIFGIIGILQWLFHARRTQKEAIKTYKQGRQVLKQFLSKPRRVVGALLIAALIALMHSLMIDFSAFALGIHMNFVDAVIAMSLGVAIGSLFPTPGGFGAVEAGIIATLIVLGYDGATAASIAILYRIATYWQPLIPGTIAYFYLRERKLL